MTRETREELLRLLDDAPPYRVETVVVEGEVRGVISFESETGEAGSIFDWFYPGHDSAMERLTNLAAMLLLHAPEILAGGGDE